MIVHLLSFILSDKQNSSVTWAEDYEDGEEAQEQQLEPAGEEGDDCLRARAAAATPKNK